MLKVLTKEEAHARRDAMFWLMEAYDVIDLAINDRRFPAIVTRVDRKAMSFDVVPLDRPSAERLLRGDFQSKTTITIFLSSSDDKIAWNSLPQN